MDDHDLVYLSGSITNRCPRESKSHFDTVEQALTAKGYLVINPTVIESKDWFDGMKQCVKKLVDCDYVYMLSGWKNSAGANIERTLAMNLKIPVVYEDDNAFNLKPQRIDG
mgnify:CR=1 FL=1